MCKRVLWSALLVAFVAVSGCGDKGLVLYPVHGSVNVDGKPVEGAVVIFCPVGGSDEVKKKRPIGYTGSDGKYQLTTIAKDDGAPAADYKIIAQWMDKVGTDKFGRPSIEGDDRLKGKYMNVDKSELKATVKGATDLPPFELKSK
jgi:hypothetical protein